MSIASGTSTNLSKVEHGKAKRSQKVDPTAASFDTFPSLSSVSAESSAPVSGLGNGHAVRASTELAGTQPLGQGQSQGAAAGEGIAALSGHTAASEGHLPSPSIPTKDVTNSERLADPSAVQLGASEPGALAGPPSADMGAGPGAGAGAGTGLARRPSLSTDPAVLALPPADVGKDERVASHLGLLKQDLSALAKDVGAHVAAGWKTAGTQTNDAWTKLQAKGQEMKVNYQRRKSISEEKSRIDEVPVAPLD